ncbi:MerR family transcriptional regulator [Mangrovimonas aestuarii]|uniref:MerR family transcriptional regulator n=1 Tax=Mangrovimonas aestuarii TaxID=3018443 RepID=UPI002379BDCF|nr:MerR family transcriptional regulator [Mangrovimonas aestuarii]
MVKYSMAQVAALSGVNAHTLRKWESRYSFIKPERTGTNIRYYSDEQLRTLINVGVLNRHGIRVSKIDKMSQAEIHDAVEELLVRPLENDEVNILVRSMLEMNEDKFLEILKSQIIRNGLLNTITGLIYPFLNQVGVLWGTKRVMPAQEHFISNLIRQKLFSAIDFLPTPNEDAPKVVLFLPEGEQHEIGLLLAYYIAKEMGWKTYYLGQNVPLDNLKEVISISKPDVMMTMFVITNPSFIQDKVKAIIDHTNLPLLVGGSMSNLKDLLEENDLCYYLRKPDQLIDFFNNFKKEVG